MNINFTDDDTNNNIINFNNGTNNNLLSILISQIASYVFDDNLSLVSKMFLIIFTTLFTLFMKTIKTIFYLFYIFIILYVLAWFADYDLMAIISKLLM